MLSTRTQPSVMSAAAYHGLATDIWAQHTQLQRFVTTCKDAEILEKIKDARQLLAEAGKLADRKSPPVR